MPAPGGMTIATVHWFLDRFDEADARAWLDGGWGVDALVGKQTRPHDDLDIMIPTEDSERLVDVLRQYGFDDVPTDDRVPENFVMGHTKHGRIDFHVFELRPDGSGIYKPGIEDWEMSTEELGANGTVGGRKVRCLTPQYQVRSHHGYSLGETDLHDLALLRETFGIELLPEQSEAVATKRGS